jgi:hypothetical protein
MGKFLRELGVLLAVTSACALILSVVHHRESSRSTLVESDNALFWGPAADFSYDPEETGGEYDAGGDNDQGLQRAADDALALCEEVIKEDSSVLSKRLKDAVPNPVKHCVHRVIPEEYTRFTNTIAGRNEWDRNTQSSAMNRIIDSFPPHTEGIMENGQIIHVPEYDRSSFQGY